MPFCTIESHNNEYFMCMCVCVVDDSELSEVQEQLDQLKQESSAREEEYNFLVCEKESIEERMSEVIILYFVGGNFVVQIVFLDICPRTHSYSL